MNDSLSLQYNRRHQRVMKRRLLLFVIISLLTAFPSVIFASTDFSVTPAVIDGKGKQREIMRFSITVANNTKHLVTLYPWVIDVENTSGATGEHDLGGTQDKDLAESLARWMEITRGSIDLT